MYYPLDKSHYFYGINKLAMLFMSSCPDFSGFPSPYIINCLCFSFIFKFTRFYFHSNVVTNIYASSSYSPKGNNFFKNSYLLGFINSLQEANKGVLKN
jgi:hypothetical protein